MVKVALIGAGDRGKDRYGKYVLNSEEIEIVAVAEPNPIKRKEVQLSHQIDEDFTFDSWEALLEKDKFCDGVIIATSDDLHFEPTIKALEKDYHVLLEKPMSNDLSEVIKIAEAEKKSNGQILVCHVLRYTPFYQKLKAIISNGRIGKVMSIQHNENIGYYHFAHSFVRGNWRNTLESSPLILAKSCHDMDILHWLSDSKCKSVFSYGGLSYFNKKNSLGYERCLNCAVYETCVFDCRKIYMNSLNNWPTSTITPIQTKEAVSKVLEEGPYGRCVFHCDNDVVDHQVNNILFENGVTATFNLCAFTNDISRTIKIMGTEGTIKGKDLKNELVIQRFGEAPEVIIPEILYGGHGGGDTGIMNDFVALLKGENHIGLTNGETSLMSHLMSFALETSRTTGEQVHISTFKKQS